MVSSGWSNIVAAVEKPSSLGLSCKVNEWTVSFVNSSSISNGRVEVGMVAKWKAGVRAELTLISTLIRLLISAHLPTGILFTWLDFGQAPSYCSLKSGKHPPRCLAGNTLTITERTEFLARLHDEVSFAESYLVVIKDCRSVDPPTGFAQDNEYFSKYSYWGLLVLRV